MSPAMAVPVADIVTAIRKGTFGSSEIPPSSQTKLAILFISRTSISCSSAPVAVVVAARNAVESVA